MVVVLGSRPLLFLLAVVAKLLPHLLQSHSLGMLPRLPRGGRGDWSGGTSRSNCLDDLPALRSEREKGVSRVRRMGSGRGEDVSRVHLETLTILGLFELTQNGTRRIHGASERFAAELALHDINRKRVLRKYRLTMLTNDTKGDAGVGVDAFFHALYTKNIRILALLGSASSDVTERLAKVVPYWNIVQVSFGSTSPSLSDRKEFPLFYRTVSPVSAHNEAVVALIRHFEWDTVTFFTENQNRFTMPMNYLVTDLERANVTCKATLTFSSSDLTDQLTNLKELDSRIIIASFSTEDAPRIFCEVYKMGMFGRDYAWILIGKPERRWWMPLEEEARSEGPARLHANQTTHHVEGQAQADGRPLSACTFAQLSATMENSLIVDRHNFIVQDMSSLSGMSGEDFRLKFQEQSLPQSPFAPETYDAVWTIALALKSLHEKQKRTLEAFDYNNTDFGAEFMSEMSKLDFTGISGPISFSGADRVGVTSFMQIHEKRIREVGLHFPRLASVSLNCSGCSGIRWHGNQVPIARREFRFKVMQVDGRTYMGVAAVATVGIVMAISFLVFNLYNRKLKYIKLSSPRLNNMVIIGSVFAYVAVILLGSDVGMEAHGKVFTYICTIRAYLLSVGFSLAFGAMFAKTYRVHRIFTRSCIGVVKNKLLRDRQLMTLIMALLAIDSFIVTSWAVFDPMYRNLQNLTLEIDPSDRSVVYQQQIKVCHSQNGHVWLSIVYGYKSLLLAVGLYMAWETRHVKIQVLNDSKYIGLCVYIVVLTSVLGVSLANLLSEKVTLSFLTVTSLILTATTITLCLLFLPKIHAILKKRHIGDPVVESSGLKIECNTRRFMVEDTKELLFRAEVQNRVYKRQIEAIDVEMWRVEKLLSSNSPDPLRILHNEKLSKKEQQRRGDENASSSLDPSSAGDSSDENSTSSEIYTVYLHRPRFIIPISLLNFRNGTKSIADLNSVAALAASALTGPRSSWPSTSQRHATKRIRGQGHGDRRPRFQSEPKLLSELEEVDSPHNSIIYEKAVSADSWMSTMGRVDVKSASRKGSGTSGGNKTSTFLSLLKFPFAYMSGFLRPPLPGARDKILISTVETAATVLNLEGADDDEEGEPMELKEKGKYSSVPDLWGVRSSPCLETRKTKGQGGRSVADSGSLCPSSSLDPLNPLFDPILRLIPTSDESPYL